MWCSLHGFHSPFGRLPCGFWRMGVSEVLREQSLYQYGEQNYKVASLTRRLGYKECNLWNTYGSQCIWRYGRREGYVMSQKKLLKRQLQLLQPVYLAEHVCYPWLWLHERLFVSHGSAHWNNFLQRSLRFPIYFSIFAKEIMASVWSFSQNKHRTWWSRTWSSSTWRWSLRLNFITSYSLKKHQTVSRKRAYWNCFQSQQYSIFYSFQSYLDYKKLMSPTYNELLRMDVFCLLPAWFCWASLKATKQLSAINNFMPVLKLKISLWPCQGTWFFEDSYFLLTAICLYLCI